MDLQDILTCKKNSFKKHKLISKLLIQTEIFLTLQDSGPLPSVFVFAAVIW